MHPVPRLLRLLVVALAALLLALAGCTLPEVCFYSRLGFAPTSSPSCQLFVLAGQSNMVGRGILADLPQEERALPHNVELRAVTLDWGLKPVQGRFGPELGFARAIGPIYTAETIVLVKFAVDGSSLLDWSPDWEPGAAALTERPDFGPLYGQLMVLVGQVREEVGNDCKVLGILWMQGERDARFPQAAEQYERNLTNLIGHFRRDLDVPNLPFLLAQINPPASTYPAVETVRAAQANVARLDEHAWLVHTDGLSKHNDGLHYDTPGQIELGQRFAQAFLELAGR